MVARNSARFEDRRDRILAVAARVFADRGYHRATMRDVARAARSSLAGIYYYFPTKEEILAEISARALDTVIAGAEASAGSARSPAERLRRFVENHLGYFAAHLTEMKVLSHESDSLSGEHRRRIQERKRAYVALATEIVSRLDAKPGRDPRAPRLAALALFGMMNWIYTWYREQGDGAESGAESPRIEVIAATMSEIFLHGFTAAGPGAGTPAAAGIRVPAPADLAIRTPSEKG